MQEAWFMVALGRQERLTSLRRFMGQVFPPPANSPEAVQGWRDWAARNKRFGVRYKKHKRPVI